MGGGEKRDEKFFGKLLILLISPVTFGGVR
jgi:hypothetical protein